MKRIYLLVLLINIIISCSNDDDSGSEIIGTWRIVSTAYKGQNMEIDECHMQHGKLIFYNHEKMTEQSGEIFGGSCHLDSGDYSYIIFENDLKMFSNETEYEEYRYKIKNEQK